MHWYMVRTTANGGPGPNGEGAHTVADERDAVALAKAYATDGALTIQTYSVTVRGTNLIGTVTLLSPHLISIMPREAPPATYVAP